MKNFFLNCRTAIIDIIKRKKIILFFGIALLIILCLAFLFDKVLAIGLLILSFLTLFTLLMLQQGGIKSRSLYILFLITFFIHLGATLFIHYIGFQPFAGGLGDFVAYNRDAQRISQGLDKMEFSLKEVFFNSPSLKLVNYYSGLVGIIYNLTLPEMLIGKLVNVWLVVLSVLFVFLIAQELGLSELESFLAGLITSIYPSLLFYSSFLLKESLFVFLILAGLLLVVKLIKNFSWSNFLIFYIVLFFATNIRFYVSYALMFSFIICWFLVSHVSLRKKIIYGIIIVPLLGFIPDLAMNQGFYGRRAFRDFMNPQVITYYREVAYVYEKAVIAEQSSPPPHKVALEQETESNIKPEPNSEVQSPPLLEKDDPKRGEGSTLVVETEFDKPALSLINLMTSFVHAVLGPFPWHIKYSRQLFVLVETIPWYFLFFFIVKGVFRAIKSRNRAVLPLVLFNLMVFGVLAIFVSNFGIFTRIRMPAFISLFCLLPLGLRGSKYGDPAFYLELKQKIIKFLTKQ